MMDNLTFKTAVATSNHINDLSWCFVIPQDLPYHIMAHRVKGVFKIDKGQVEFGVPFQFLFDDGSKLFGLCTSVHVETQLVHPSKASPVQIQHNPA